MSSKREETPESIAKRAAMNQEILETLRAELAENPSLNLDYELPRLKLEAKRKYFPHPTAALLQQRRRPPMPKPRGFPTALLTSEAKPTVLRSLSQAAKALIFGATGGDGDYHHDEDSLDQGLRRVLQSATVVAELPGRGGVLRCRDKSGIDIAIKVVGVSTNGAETEYSSLRYLEEHAPCFPAPKPHGLIRFGNSKLLMMSYVPSVTLRSVWHTLSDENKLSIQSQLDQLFTQLRQLKRQSGERLGGVGGEGVRDNRAWVEHVDSETIMTTAAQFRTFQFSIPSPCGAEYAAFLRSLLPHPDPRAQAVFTHGDVSPLNIMVDKDPKAPGQYVVTGIIDWEESGFYPAWFESSKVLYSFGENGRGELQDWWRYLPHCIAPKRYAVEWVIGRLWDKANGIGV